MARFLRVAAWGLAGTAVAVAVAAYAAVWVGERKAVRIVEVKVSPIAIREDAAGIAHGKYLFESRGCMECHGAGAGGKQVIDDPGGLRVRAPDLTRANPAIAAYQPVDWVRSIRHGVAPSHRPLLIMPSEDYNRLSDEDLGALVGYLRSLPPAMGRPRRSACHGRYGRCTAWASCRTRLPRSTTACRCSLQWSRRPRPGMAATSPMPAWGQGTRRERGGQGSIWYHLQSPFSSLSLLL